MGYELTLRPVRTQILGALLTLTAKVHAGLSAAKVEGRMRMADFARVLAAVDEEMGTDRRRHYLKHLVRDAADSIDDSPFITELVGQRYSCQDTPSVEILAAVEEKAKDGRSSLFGGGRSTPRNWPKPSRQVTAELTRHANAMRLRGWQVDSDDGRNHHNRVQWTIIPPAWDRKGQDKAQWFPPELTGAATVPAATWPRRPSGGTQRAPAKALRRSCA